MSPKPALAIGLCIAFAGLTGCIERTITINSDPPGALVHLNDVEIGRTPVTVPFTFYGVYDVRLEKQGFQTLSVAQKADGPWWEEIGPDIFAEAMPGVHRVELDWRYTLEPIQPVSPDALIDRAKQLRATVDREVSPAGSATAPKPGLSVQPIPANPPAAKPIVEPAAPIAPKNPQPARVPTSQDSP